MCAVRQGRDGKRPRGSSRVRVGMWMRATGSHVAHHVQKVQPHTQPPSLLLGMQTAHSSSPVIMMLMTALHGGDDTSGTVFYSSIPSAYLAVISSGCTPFPNIARKLFLSGETTKTKILAGNIRMRARTTSDVLSIPGWNVPDSLSTYNVFSFTFRK